jgi:hypothetical protein
MNKLFFAFCLCCFSFLSFSQNNLLSLQIKTDDKPSLHGFSYWQHIKVVSKDTSFVYHLHTGNPDVIANLKPGTYKVAVSSIFNHYISKKIGLNKKTPLLKFSGLAAYYFKPKTNANLSEKLKLNDTLFVVYSNTQDENAKEKIAITKTQNGYTAIQYAGISNEVVHYMMISAETYKKFVPKFETEGKKNNSPKAETAPLANICSIELNKELVTFIIPGKWDGFDNLKAPLFVVQAK